MLKAESSESPYILVYVFTETWSVTYKWRVVLIFAVIAA
jgi:hypothetical protein